MKTLPYKGIYHIKSSNIYIFCGTTFYGSKKVTLSVYAAFGRTKCKKSEQTVKLQLKIPYDKAAMPVK
jgi:hypothetical protein